MSIEPEREQLEQMIRADHRHKVVETYSDAIQLACHVSEQMKATLERCQTCEKRCSGPIACQGTRE